VEHMTTIRHLVQDDCPVIARAFAEQGWNKPASQYEAYLREGAGGKRVVLVAESGGRFAGYVTIVWESGYPPFREARIPEIVDLNVLREVQRRGVATALLDEAEARIAERSPVAGIGVGLTHDYGAAQVLYVRRGYVPDGRGLIGRGRQIEPGEQVAADDCELYLTRPVVRPEA